MQTASDIEYIKVSTELEALLLEAKLINKYKPKYNSVLKDDKHPLYIVITNEKFPRVITCRKLHALSYRDAFGPFPNSTTVKQVLRMLRRIFPYSDHKIGKRACLYSHIGLCNPCPNEILQITNDKLQISNKRLYLRNIKNLKSILNGKVSKVKIDLEKQMHGLSNNEKFEEAAEIREKLKKLVYITQSIIPTEAYIENPNLSEEIRDSELRELKEILKSYIINLKSLRRIECYDIAHLTGSNPTASMVVFINGEADKSEYRHFKIRQVKSQSDYDSMREIARRRLKQSWNKPDLIIVDGGVGQVRQFYKIITNIPVVGIAKNPDRLIIDKDKIRLTGPALNLVQRIRDEAHRFARRLHHKNIKKKFLATSKN